MIDARNSLTVLHDNNSSFSDYSNDSADYIRDNFSIALDSTTDYLYIGFSRNFGACYVELPVPNTEVNSFVAEYFNGTTWDVLSVQDETRGFTRSGFLLWDKAQLKSTTVNSTAAYYIRLRPSVTHTSTSVRAINIVFSDDTTMKREFYEITNTNILPPGETSHISAHVASRDMIVQQLRNMQYIKTDESGVDHNITPWDLHDMFEIRQAATFLSLSKIFFNLSDSVDDNWWQKYTVYNSKFEEAFRLARISLDLDNDGVQDTEEKLRPSKSWRWNR